ncbi:peptidyl-prolyl cis-trans isomerase sig-7 [Anopheles stephensi]|uniref:peptidyl-prolyl cis-trans isomerase sig-7 n=1 Tax=Anopheles stephensi TaxID=30069 RepID=UPI0016589D85|nr:peptidyl-prolyl cis-trans isomerase sig-7 [Anopheles stephensi]
MSVVIETTIGDITVDLFLKERPRAALNFLKLCKLKYYNYNLFHTIQSEFIAQTGDPTGAGDGGMSIWGILEGNHKRYFEGESVPKIKHSEPGLLSMVNAGEHLIGSQFFFTLGADLTSLDGRHTVIGEVTEGHEVLRKLNETICDERHRPYKDVRITHTVVLDDPFEDPRGFREPSRSPSPSAERLQGGRIAADEEIDDLGGKTEQEIAEMIAEREAKARATILEIVGDIPDADIAPPENVLFVCKLNPVTTDDDLQIIFSRFGKIKGCEVIRDKLTGDSLQYAFIEFENQKSCEDAYFKMDNVLIDDRRIHVDFSQSVSKVKWRGKGRGIEFKDGADKRSFKDFDRKKQNQQQHQQQQNRNGGPNKRQNASPKREREQEKQSTRSESGSRSRSSSRSRPAKDDRRQRSRSRERMQHRERDRNRPQGRRDAPEGGSRGRKPQLTERNSAYLEQRNGRDIRINQGKVDYKNRPYPDSFVQRKGPRDKSAKRGGPTGGGRSGSGMRPEPPPRRRSRSRSRDRRQRRSRSRSRDRRYSPDRYRSQRSHSREARGRRQIEPERVGSRSSPSQQRSEADYRRSGGAAAVSSKPAPSGSRDREQRRESDAPLKRRSSSSVSRSSPPPKEKRKRKSSSSSPSSRSDSSSPSSSSDSDERSKKRKKKSSKKKSKSSRKRKGSGSSDDEKNRKKSKGKKKKRKH